MGYGPDLDEVPTQKLSDEITRRQLEMMEKICPYCHHPIDSHTCRYKDDIEVYHKMKVVHIPGIEEFWESHAHWSQKTFGDDKKRGPLGPLKHLEDEAAEARRAVEFGKGADIEEHADCMLLILDATRRAGFSWINLLGAMWRKLEKNKKRKWPNNIGPNESVNHIQ